MFTGLIQEVGKINSVHTGDLASVLEVHAPHLCGEKLQIGESVAINGICLTLVTLKPDHLIVEAGAETVRRTTIRSWAIGDEVNLERALRVNGRLDGHWVAGHVDGVAEVRAVIPEGASRRIEFAVPSETGRYIAAKGSVAIDGVSLTIAEATGMNSLTVSVIPHTLQHTTLGALRPGDRVNLEVDLLARYLEKLLERRDPKGITWEKLAAAGFLNYEEGERSSW